MPSAVVLVADHNPLQRQLIDLLLAEDGYQVVTVETGREALEYLREHTPDIAILDLKLYDMSSADVCEKMKGVTRLNPVPVILTAPPRAGVAIDARTKSLAYFVGANLVLQKPLGDKNLRLRVRGLLEQGNATSLSTTVEATESTLVIEEAIRSIDDGSVPEPQAPADSDPRDEAAEFRAKLPSAGGSLEMPEKGLNDGDNGSVGRDSRLPQKTRVELDKLRAKVAEQARTIEDFEKRNALLLEALEEEKRKLPDSRGLFGRRRSS